MERMLTDLPPVLTDRLCLRPLKHADADPFRAMTAEPAILAAIHFLSAPFSIADAERLILGDGDGRDCFWGVWLRDEHLLLGTVGTHLRSAEGIEIGYWFAAAARGRGLASEAVRGIVRTLADAYPHRRIYAECKPENQASWRLLEKLGFKLAGGKGHRPGRKLFVWNTRSGDLDRPDRS